MLFISCYEKNELQKGQEVHYSGMFCLFRNMCISHIIADQKLKTMLKYFQTETLILFSMNQFVKFVPGPCWSSHLWTCINRCIPLIITNQDIEKFSSSRQSRNIVAGISCSRTLLTIQEMHISQILSTATNYEKHSSNLSTEELVSFSTIVISGPVY